MSGFSTHTGIKKVAWAICEVQDCEGTKKNPCDGHMTIASEYFVKMLNIICDHDWEYKDDGNHFDWFECSKCGLIRDKGVVF